MPFDSSLFDKRVIEKNLRAGLVSREEYLRYLESLEDCSDLATNSQQRLIHSRRAGARRQTMTTPFSRETHYFAEYYAEETVEKLPDDREKALLEEEEETTDETSEDTSEEQDEDTTEDTTGEE